MIVSRWITTPSLPAAFIPRCAAVSAVLAVDNSSDTLLLLLSPLLNQYAVQQACVMR